jgi:hypothetical protein
MNVDDGLMWESLLQDVWAELTGEPVLPAAAEVTGPAVALPSALPLTDAMVATVGASLAAGAVLEGIRAGRDPAPIQLDTSQLALAFRSEQNIRHNGRRESAGFGPLSRFFPTSDGWIRLHANYPWHRERLLWVLGAGDDPDAVARAVAGWRGEDLEDALADAGGCGAAVRGVAQWRKHPQGAAAAALPLVELLRAGAAPRRSWGPGARPASGVRVLDLTRVIAGPVCTRVLAAHGADVLRIDNPAMPDLPSQLLDSLPGKRSAFLDLRSPGAPAALEDLLAGAHVVVLGYRPGTLSRFGLDPADLVIRHPGLVVVTLSAWGHEGPWAHRRGFDSLVQAAAGIARVEMGNQEEPGVLPAQALDHATGYLAAAAVMAALARQAKDGGTWHARLSLAQTAAWLLRQRRTDATAGGDVPAEPYLVELRAPGGVVAVIGPPGKIGGRPLRWPGQLHGYGQDRPAW